MPVKASIRMYNQLDLGDCFLLNFQNGEKNAFLLIDFGSYRGGNAAREAEIAGDIVGTVKDAPLTIVLTHQHKDHLSGFLNAGDLLKGKGNDRSLWLSYLDNEKSKEGVTIRSMTEKYWNKTKKTKALLKEKFPTEVKIQAMVKEKEGYDLFAEEQTGGKAISKLLEIANGDVSFLTPGEAFQLPGMEGDVNVYVLGPPSDSTLLTKMNPNKTEEVRSLNSMMELANMDISGTLMLDALENINDANKSKSNDFPFNRKYVDDDPASHTTALYEKTENSWRRIDHEWLSEIGRLSLYMDRLTNNTSLVLAFELVASGKVLLFVGDAQIGNWRSWLNVKFDGNDINAEDLLSRTVLYKAGHHSSHNATLKQGLDMMNEKELIIMIPVNEEVSSTNDFAMLKPEMLTGYNRKSQGRVIRADTIEQAEGTFKTPYAFKTRDDFDGKLSVIPSEVKDHLALELVIDEGAAGNSVPRNIRVFKKPVKLVLKKKPLGKPDTGS